MEAVSLLSLVFVVHFKVLATSTVYGETVDEILSIFSL